MNNNLINVGIGFVTGRKCFSQIARTYTENWHESGLTGNENINLNIFVAYDLKYKNTKPADYENLDKRVIDMLDYPFYIGEAAIKSEMAMLVSAGVLTMNEAELLFGDGYAKKRNAVMYFAIKSGMDYLLFIDDDEYPLAVINQPNGLIWKGQQVLLAHLDAIENADITHGRHCGYVSPIPYIPFNELLTEKDFQIFIETISNDIITWKSIKEKMHDGGVTYANKNIIENRYVEVVNEINGAKFISGSNLCINLKNKNKLFPFYNPPGARGEDTFLSTCLSNHQVLKVPCYTFHDGFSSYQHLLCGTLPEYLKPICAGQHEIDDRFLKACIGWVRYKPLLLYITKRNSYEVEIKQMKRNLKRILPKVCGYFGNNDFMKLQAELEFYSENVMKHFEMFEATKTAWEKTMDYLSIQNYRGLTRVN